MFGQYCKANCQRDRVELAVGRTYFPHIRHWLADCLMPAIKEITKPPTAECQLVRVVEVAVYAVVAECVLFVWLYIWVQTSVNFDTIEWLLQSSQHDGTMPSIASCSHSRYFRSCGKKWLFY
jgi:hypothetical protein